MTAKTIGARPGPDANPPEDNELLTFVGDSLWGTDWTNEMALVLGVNIRTVQRWITGAMPIPAGVWDELASLCHSESRALAGLELVLRDRSSRYKAKASA